MEFGEIKVQLFMTSNLGRKIFACNRYFIVCPSLSDLTFQEFKFDDRSCRLLATTFDQSLVSMIYVQERL